MLKCIEPVTLDNVVLGQYVGTEDGSQPGYKDGEFLVVLLILPCCVVDSMMMMVIDGTARLGDHNSGEGGAHVASHRKQTDFELGLFSRFRILAQVP